MGEVDLPAVELPTKVKPQKEQEAVLDYVDINNPDHGNLTYAELQKQAKK